MMPAISLNNKLIVSSINNNYKFIFFGLILITYFAWMDIALFINLQKWSPPPLQHELEQKAHLTKNSFVNLTNNNFKNTELIEHNIILSKNQNLKQNSNINPTNSTSINSQLIQNSKIRYNYADSFSVFKPLSVKLIMIDHVTHYVHDILARFLEDTLHFTQIFPWVTANLVSFAGLFLAFVGSRLIISDNILYCRLGAILFEMRNLADSLDGVVYRSRQRRFELEQNQQFTQVAVYQSNYGSFGYNVDVICDGLGGLFLCIAIFIKFLKHLPHKNTNRLLLRKCKGVNIDSNSNYSYLRLENSENEPQFNLLNSRDLNENKYDLIQMDEFTFEQNGEENKSPFTNLRSISNKNLNEKENSVIPNVRLSPYAAEDANDFMQKRHVSSRQVKLIVISFGLRLLFTGLIWDHYVHKYHDLLMEFSNNPTQRRMQAQAFKSISMWLIMWFWRLGNACAILEHLVITTFFNKLWDYLVFTSYIGWAYLILLTLFTQIHYIELYESLNSLAAFT